MSAVKVLFAVAPAVLVVAAVAVDSNMVQGICVADLASDINVYGFPCKATFNETDFFSDVLVIHTYPNITTGSVATAASVLQIPGLNTLEISLSRTDYAPVGLNPPHTHPGATEVVFVLSGGLEVGFITTDNVLMSRSIQQFEIFVFPRGLVHFLRNRRDVLAMVLSACNSELPGTQSVATTLFASKPGIADYLLAEAFQIAEDQAETIKKKFTTK